MPLIYIHQDENVYVNVWEITEDESFFKAAMTGKLTDHSVQLDQIRTSHHRLQYLASRYLITEMLSEFQPLELFKSAYGKTYLKNQPVHLSVSHTSNFVAIITSRLPSGIDIEINNRDVSKVQHKFINSSESIWIKDLSDVLSIWCCKEVAYKIYEKKEVDFKENMTVRYTNSDSFTALIDMNDHKCEYLLRKKNIKNLLIVWGFEGDIVNL